MTIPGSARRTLIAQAIMLLSHYGFDTKPHTTAERMGHWLDEYEADWIRTAIIEALYQGRYKAISVEHILSLWQKRGRPSPHFTGDFERIICRKLPEWYMNISTIESDAAVNEPAAAELPVFSTTASTPPITPPMVTPGVQRWRQLAQIGQGATPNEGMIARLRSFAYLDVTAPPQIEASPTAPAALTVPPTEREAVEAIAPLLSPQESSDTVNETCEPSELAPEDQSDAVITAIADLEDEIDLAAEAPDLEAVQGSDSDVMDFDGVESGAQLACEDGLDRLREAELNRESDAAEDGELELTPATDATFTAEAAFTPEREPAAVALAAQSTPDSFDAVAPAPAIDTAILAEAAPITELADETGEDSDRPTSPTANLLLLSQSQTVQPRPALDLPNPKRVGPTFRSGIRTFVPALELSPFLARLLQFYATLPEPETVDPFWAAEPLPVSLERS